LPGRFQVLEKSGDQGCVQVGEVKIGGWFAGLLPGEPQQQADGVAVGRHGVGAGLTLADQPIGEIALQDTGE